MQIQPYLFFNGRTEEALEFYREVLGAEILMKMRFKDAPSSPPGPFGAVADKFGVSWMVIAGQKNAAPQ